MKALGCLVSPNLGLHRTVFGYIMKTIQGEMRQTQPKFRNEPFCSASTHSVLTDSASGNWRCYSRSDLYSIETGKGTNETSPFLPQQSDDKTCIVIQICIFEIAQVRDRAHTDEGQRG